jgi:hypothetical protein
MVLLQELANIRTGYLFRAGSPTGPAPNVWLLQIKDISADGRLQAVTNQVYVPEVPREQFIQPQDVLFISRGTRWQAVAIESALPNTIASYQFFVLRLLNSLAKSLLPGYLAWYINQPVAQQYLKAHCRGSHVLLITKETLGTLPVVLPAYREQELIVQLQKLSFREKDLRAAIAEKRAMLLEQALQQTLLTIDPELHQVTSAVGSLAESATEVAVDTAIDPPLEATAILAKAATSKPARRRAPRASRS